MKMEESVLKRREMKFSRRRSMKMEESVSKRREIKFRRRTIYEDGTECLETSGDEIQTPHDL